MSFDFSQFPRLEIGGKRVKKIARKSDGQVLWTAGYINMVPLSINADGTIYNGGLGYKEGYRVRSGGAEGESDNAVCTGFIPFKKGDILRIYPAFIGRNTDNAINFADASFTNLGQNTASGASYGICGTNESLWDAAMANVVNGVTVVDISNIPNAGDVAYVRITNFYGTASGQTSPISSGAELIVTVNEEITV